jgi:hypothetical protein
MTEHSKYRVITNDVSDYMNLLYTNSHTKTELTPLRKRTKRLFELLFTMVRFNLYVAITLLLINSWNLSHNL